MDTTVLLMISPCQVRQARLHESDTVACLCGERSMLRIHDPMLAKLSTILLLLCSLPPVEKVQSSALQGGVINYWESVIRINAPDHVF